MGLIFCDGFDSYSTSAELIRNWPGAAFTGTCFNATAGRLGGGAFQTVATSVTLQTLNSTSVMLILNNSQTLGISFWLKVSTPPSASTMILNFFNSNNGLNGGIHLVTGTGVLRLVSTAQATIATGGTNVCDNAWHWVEICFAPTNGSAVRQACYVDNISQWDSNLSTGSANNIVYMTLTSPATTTFTIDDFFLFDSTSPDPRTINIPAGPKQINTLRPNADNSVQFTPNSGGTNYNLVNESSGDEDASYVASNSSGQVDTYTYDDLAFTPLSITAVQLTSRLKNPGAGTFSFKTRCISGITTTDSASIVTSSAYNNTKTIFNQDPNTSAAWTTANLNSAKFGVTVV